MINMRINKLQLPLIIFSVAMILSLLTFVNFTVFNISIIKIFQINYLKTQFTIPVSFINYNILLGIFNLTITLILFIIGIIFLIPRFINQFKIKSRINKQKNLLVSSLILILAGFILFATSYLKFIIFSLYIPNSTFSNILNDNVYVIEATAFYNYFIQGFIILAISLISLTIGIIIFRKAINSRYTIAEKSQKAIEQISDINNNQKSFSIPTIIATVLSISALITFIIFNRYYSNTTLKEIIPLGINGKLMSFSSICNYYMSGFALYTISLGLFIVGLIQFIKRSNLNESNRKNDSYTTNSKSEVMSDKMLKSYFVAISIGVIFASIAYSRFILFNGQILMQDRNFAVTYYGFQNYYFPGLYLFGISSLSFIIGMIQLILYKYFTRRSELSNNLAKKDSFLSLIPQKT